MRPSYRWRVEDNPTPDSIPSDNGHVDGGGGGVGHDHDGRSRAMSSPAATPTSGSRTDTNRTDTTRRDTVTDLDGEDNGQGEAGNAMTVKPSWNIKSIIEREAERTIMRYFPLAKETNLGPFIPVSEQVSMFFAHTKHTSQTHACT